MKLIYLLPLFAIVVMAFQSCQRDRLEFDKISSQMEISPHYIVPVMQADITLRDILKERTDTVKYDKYATGDTLITIFHRVDSLYTMTSKDYLEELPVIEPMTRSHSLGLLPQDGYFEDDFVERMTFDSVVSVYFDPADREDYRLYSENGASISSRSQTKDLSKKAKPFFLPFPNIRSAEFGQGDITALVENTFDVPVKFDLVLASNDGGWKEIKRFHFNSLIPVQGIDSVTEPATGIVLDDIRTQSFGYYFENLEFGSKTGGSIDVDAQLEILFKLKQCKLVRGIVKLPPEQQKFNQDTTQFFDITVYKDKELKEMKMLSGQLNYSIESSFERAIAVELKFPGVDLDGDALLKKVVATPNSTFESSFPLDGYHVDLTQDYAQQYNRLKVDLSYHLNAGENWIEFDSSDAVSATFFNVDSLEFLWAKGNLGHDTVLIDQESIDYNLSETFDGFSGGRIVFTDPKMRLNLTNSAGVSGDIELVVEGEGRNGNAQDLFNNTPELISVSGPDFKGDDTIVKKDVITFDRNHSNIVEFIANVPQKLNYSGRVLTNNGVPYSEIDNFVHHDAVTNVGVEAELPLAFLMQDLTLRKYYASSIGEQLSIDGFDEAAIQELALYFNVKNQFPLDVELVYTLWDTVPDDDVFLDTLHVSVLNSAKPDAIGKVGRDVVKEYSDAITIRNAPNDSILQHFLDCNVIAVDIVLNTASGGEKEIKMFTHYTLNLGMMVGLKGTFRSKE